MEQPERLVPLLRPRSIAVVGATQRPGAFGQRLLTNLATWGFAGNIYPINPGYDTLQDLQCYPSLSSLPNMPDCVAFAVSDDRIEEAVTAAAAAGVKAAMIFGRGYEAPTPNRQALSERLGAILLEAGMVACGNNCMGFISAVHRVRMSANPPPMPDRVGCIGLVSHSGSTWSGLVGNQRDLAFNYAISAGQEIATGVADYFHYLLAQPETRVIACVLETVRQPEPFLEALQQADKQGIPVVVLKLGRTESGRRFALAHSGALSGSDAAYGAVFARHNVIRVHSIDELADTIEVLSSPRRPTARALGVVTNSGGERELVVDIANDVGCPIAEVSPGTSDRLAAILDPGMLPVNPVDAFGDGRFLIEDCLKALATDDAVGAVALSSNLVYGRAGAHAEGVAVQNAHTSTDKPVILSGNLHSSMCRDELTRLRGLGIPVVMGTETSLLAIRHFFDWHYRRPIKSAAPTLDQAATETWRQTLIDARGKPLDQQTSLALFAAFGGNVVRTEQVGSEPELIQMAAALGYPVVLKTASAEVLHKSDQGGVELGIADEASLRAAYARMTGRFGPACLLQQQIEPGVEILLGMVNDAQFGPMVTVGLGGIFTEIFGDAVTICPPITEEEARRQLTRLKGYQLLLGARGRPAVNIDALAHMIQTFSTLCIAVGPWLAEMDINPLIANQHGLFAVDALAVPMREPRE